MANASRDKKVKILINFSFFNKNKIGNPIANANYGNLCNWHKRQALLPKMIS